jgi:hypothetical protein
MTTPDDDGFVSRWSRRKALAREGRVSDEPLPATPPNEAPAPPTPGEAEVAPQAAEALPPPTLDDVASLTRDADFSRFVAPGVDEGVKQAALKKLFSDPRFNVMDGLDTYIDDYNRADPLPASMLRKMAQSAFLGLVREDDENADLQLQPDDAAGRPGAEPGAEGEPGCDRDDAA